MVSIVSKHLFHWDCLTIFPESSKTSYWLFQLDPIQRKKSSVHYCFVSSCHKNGKGSGLGFRLVQNCSCYSPVDICVRHKHKCCPLIGLFEWLLDVDWPIEDSSAPVTVTITVLFRLSCSGLGGSSLSREAQTSLSPATSSSSSRGIPRRSQASRET